MSQTFAATSSYYNIGAPSNLTNITAGGYVAIVRSSNPAVSRVIYDKGATAPVFRRININASEALAMSVGSAATTLQAVAPMANFAGVLPGKWCVVAGRFNTAATNADQQLFACPVGGALAGPSSYTTQVVGSSHGSDGSGVAHIGDSTANTLGFTDPLAALAVFNAYPTQEELQQVANELLVRGRKLRLPASVKGAWQLTQRGTLPDLSGNGNHGAAGGGIIGQAGDPVWKWPRGIAASIGGFDVPAAAAGAGGVYLPHSRGRRVAAVLNGD